MKKQLITVGPLFLVFISCQNKPYQLESNKILTDRIESGFKSESGLVEFQNFTDFIWDNVLIFGPYSTIENVEKENKLELSNIRGNLISSRDDINLLVFIKNKKSIKIAEVSREIGDFTDLQKLIPKQKAKFIKTSRANQTIQITISPEYDTINFQ